MTQSLLKTILSILLSNVGTADELPELQTAAASLQQHVTTVRIAAEGEVAPDKVTVCSGILLQQGVMVAPIYAGSDSSIRATLPGGQQATGRVRVIDEYSGLALIQLEDARSPSAFEPMRLAAEIPAAGAWVLSAAGWGTEQPVVSLGIVSGNSRAVPGLNYPPLLQCDLRAAQTSSGAAVVNRNGELIGVVVLAEKEQATGWTYAIPVRHVRRLLNKYEDVKESDKFVVLKRRRPEVGMVLDGQLDDVRVSRVRDASPAERAGFRVGEQIVAVDGTQIRSVYQALRPVLIKQPGDEVSFTVRSQGELIERKVILAGEMELPAAPFANLARYVQPKVDVERSAGVGIRARDGRGTVREVSVNADDEFANRPDANSADASTDEKIRLLEKSLERYQQAVRLLQERLQQQEAEQTQLRKQLEQLQKADRG